MRLGINASSLLSSPDLAAMRAHAEQAAADGFSSWWLAQTGAVDALIALTTVAEAAPGLELGTAVIPTYPRHPSALASQALTAQAAAGGRITLGIGLSHKPAVEDRWGLSFERPIRHFLDYLNVLQPLLAGEAVDYRGEMFTYISEPQARPTDTPPSLMVAALGEQMLKIAGKRTDGTILWMVGPATIESHIAPVMNEAAASADRPAPRVLCSLPVAVTDDVEGSKAFANAVLEIYGQLPSYRAMLDREGAQNVGDVCVFGSEEQVTDHLHRIAASGATDFTAVEFVGDPDSAARTRATLQKVAAELA